MDRMLVVDRRTFAELESAEPFEGRRRADSDSLINYGSGDRSSHADACDFHLWSEASTCASWADEPCEAATPCSESDAQSEAPTHGSHGERSETLGTRGASEPLSDDEQFVDLSKRDDPPGCPAPRATRRRGRRAARTAPLQASTLVLRQLPSSMTRDEVAGLLDVHGFVGLYDFLYSPVDFESGEGLGYALVNFLTAAAAEAALSMLAGLQLAGRALQLERSRTHTRGLQGLIERFRASPVMSADRPEAHKPLLLRHGRPVPFPTA